MSVVQITKKEFDSKNPARVGTAQIISTEKSWYADSDRNILGTVILDHIDKDWTYIVLGRHEDGLFRCIDLDTSIESKALAEQRLQDTMSKMEVTDQATESLYKTEKEKNGHEKSSIVLTDINLELKKYFNKHPEKLYNLSSRKFEELIASILEDFGFDVQLTKATRDGGSDIIAYIRNSVCEYLTLVECKKYAPSNKVGVGIIREVSGVHHLKRASKSIIVTTSFFSKDAVEEAKAIEHQLQLKDYEDLKDWLSQYS